MSFLAWFFASCNTRTDEQGACLSIFVSFVFCFFVLVSSSAHCFVPLPLRRARLCLDLTASLAEANRFRAPSPHYPSPRIQNDHSPGPILSGLTESLAFPVMLPSTVLLGHSTSLPVLPNIGVSARPRLLSPTDSRPRLGSMSSPRQSYSPSMPDIHSSSVLGSSCTLRDSKGTHWQRDLQSARFIVSCSSSLFDSTLPLSLLFSFWTLIRLDQRKTNRSGSTRKKSKLLSQSTQLGEFVSPAEEEVATEEEVSAEEDADAEDEGTVGPSGQVPIGAWWENEETSARMGSEAYAANAAKGGDVDVGAKRRGG